MKRGVGIAAVGALALLTLPVVANDQMERDKRNVEALVRDIYAKKARDFEFPTKKNAATNCEYLASIFDASMISRGEIFCEVVGGSSRARFPSLSDTDLSDLNESNVIPKFRIVESGVKGEAAVVKVQAPIAKDLQATRIVYFLKKSEDRWRISNILAFSEWPLDTRREGGCKDASGYYHYVLPPRSVFDLEDLPRACQELELRKRPELGKTR